MKTARPSVLWAVALCSAVAAGPLAAEPIEEKNLVKGKATIASDRGYIYLQSDDRYAGTFIRVPDAEDLAAYRVVLDEALGKARKRYERKLAQGKREAEQARKAGVAAKPVEPFDPGSVAVTPIEVTNAVQFGPTNVYTKDEGAFTYLTEVKPGTYIWYGPVAADSQQGMVGQCLCMGTVQFEVAGGRITNLGNALFALPDYGGQRVAPPMDVFISGGWTGNRLDLPTTNIPARYDLPDSLRKYPVAQVEFHAAGKMNNFYGLMITRLPAIDGVLAYDRDTVIDARTGARLEAKSLAE